MSEPIMGGRTDGIIAEHLPRSSSLGMRDESKREAFRRLAEKRTNAIFEKIRILGNCANPYAYEWEEEDVRTIFAAIENELKLAKTRFAQSQRSRPVFKLRQ